MGISERKHQIEHEPVTFDFAKVAAHVSKADQPGLRTEDDDGRIIRQAATVVGRLTPHDGTMVRALLALTDSADASGDPCYPARAAKYLIRASVQTLFPDPKTVRKRDRMMYAAWLPALDYDEPDTVTMRIGQVDWLRDLLGKLRDADDGKGPALPIELSQWLVATVDYAHDVYERAIAERPPSTPAE